MIARALVPAGFMLSEATDGSHRVVVTLCTGHGPVQTFVMEERTRSADEKGAANAHQRDQAPTKTTQSDAPCVFAAMATLSAPELAPPLTIKAYSFYVAPPVLTDVAIGHGLAAPPPWSTGPPHFS